MEANLEMPKTYPAVFREECGGVWFVIFPDLGCVTCGDTKDEAEAKAKETLSYWLSYEDDPVKPSPMADVIATTELGDEVILIEAHSEYLPS